MALAAIGSLMCDRAYPRARRPFAIRRKGNIWLAYRHLRGVVAGGVGLDTAQPRVVHAPLVEADVGRLCRLDAICGHVIIRLCLLEFLHCVLRSEIRPRPPQRDIAIRAARIFRSLDAVLRHGLLHFVLIVPQAMAAERIGRMSGALALSEYFGIYLPSGKYHCNPSLLHGAKPKWR